MLKFYACMFVLNTWGIGAFEMNIQNNDTKVYKDTRCEFCILENCLHMTENKCEYYNKVDELLCNKESQNDGGLLVADQTEIKKITAVVYDFVNDGLEVLENGKCVPLISQYSDCHRDNICTGCYFCKCDSSGQWDCNVRQRCEQVTRVSTVTTRKLLSFMIDAFFKPDFNTSLDNETEQFNLTTNVVHPNTPHKIIRQKRENLEPKYVNNKYFSTSDLKLNALYPLTNIIQEKVVEILDLSKIRNYLSEYLQSLGVTDVTNKINDFETLKQNFKYPEFVIYKFETNKKATLNSRIRSKPNILHRINENIKQLASDIYDAEKVMTKNKKTKLPNDLKKIMLVLTHYLKKQNITKKSTRKSNIHYNWIESIEKSISNETSTFRHHTHNNKTNGFNIDNNFTLTNSTLKILKQIAENLNLISHTDHEENSTYNIIDILTQVGRSWRKLYYNIKHNNSYNRLDSVKLFHLTLSIDTSKIIKILNNIDNISKLKSVDKSKCDMLIRKIDLGLSLMQKSIMKISLGNKDLNNNDIKHRTNATTNQKKYQDTLLHRIGKVLKNTKKDVVAILKSKFTHLSKALTSEELAKLNEKKIKNYESVMLDWQNKLNIGLRRRRSVLRYQPNTRKIRLTHILPKYLRGKMNPIIINKKNNKNNTKKLLRMKH